MLSLMARNWWAIALRGVAAIAFGILTIALPGLTLLSLVFLFGAYALIDGVSSIVAAVRGEPGTRGHGLFRSNITHERNSAGSTKGGAAGGRVSLASIMLSTFNSFIVFSG